MKFKKVISTLSAMSVLFSSGVMVANAVNTVEVDNDTIASGCSNSNSGCTYITGNTLYNGDARISSSSEHGEYRWYFPNQVDGQCTKDVAIFAYLDHGEFTDPEAKYYINDGPSKYNVEYVGSINQNKASRGWNYVATNATFAGVSLHAEVRSSDKNGSRMGADAIRVTYY